MISLYYTETKEIVLFTFALVKNRWNINLGEFENNKKCFTK